MSALADFLIRDDFSWCFETSLCVEIAWEGVYSTWTMSTMRLGNSYQSTSTVRTKVLEKLRVHEQEDWHMVTSAGNVHATLVGPRPGRHDS